MAWVVAPLEPGEAAEVAQAVGMVQVAVLALVGKARDWSSLNWLPPPRSNRQVAFWKLRGLVSFVEKIS